MLDKHLDPDSEPSIAVRAVYGKWLTLLDEQWTADNTARILPASPELAELRDAAWNTYVGWCPPFNAVYEMLRHEYKAAVERVPSSGTVDVVGYERADAKLGEHLVTFHWHGCLRPGLLDRWGRKMARVRPIHAGVIGEWIRKVPASDRCVGRSVLCGTAETPDLGRGCSDLPVREARMDHDGCPR